jgi:hypothetical protein
LTTEFKPIHTKIAHMPTPMSSPAHGIMVTHFSRGSFFASHGFDTVPFLTLLLWKYRPGTRRFGCDENLAENPDVDPGTELAEPYGTLSVIGEIGSEKSAVRGVAGTEGVEGRVSLTLSLSPTSVGCDVDISCIRIKDCQ